MQIPLQCPWCEIRVVAPIGQLTVLSSPFPLEKPEGQEECLPMVLQWPGGGQCSHNEAAFLNPPHPSLVQGSASHLPLCSETLSVMSCFLTVVPCASCEGKQSLEQAVLPSW